MWLCTGRVLEQWHTGSMTNRVSELRRAMPDCYVELNSADALELGVRSGNDVVVETLRGSLTLPAWIGGRGEPPKGSIFIPFFDEKQLVNNLTLDAICPISKQPDYKKCAARIKKA
ncbi:MAG: molybdopterin dinucleotide binding domain-containing protein [Phycisphaerales bacterium]|nr:molybdopterin dinucleotide binding domain-containing protein [Phycisphaerales bacterium]